MAIRAFPTLAVLLGVLQLPGTGEVLAQVPPGSGSGLRVEPAGAGAAVSQIVAPRPARRRLRRLSIPALDLTYNLDTATPALVDGQNAPFDQMLSGVTAHFEGPFSVQSAASTHYTLSQFSGHYLYPNGFGPVLLVSFSRPVTSVSLTYATADFGQVEVPTTVKLTAFDASSPPLVVGSASSHGFYGSDTMPMGTVSFTSTAQAFTQVEVRIPPGPQVAAGFLVDNITVTTVAVPSR